MEEEVSECHISVSKVEGIRGSAERNQEIVQSWNGSMANGTQTRGNRATVGICASQFVPHVRKNVSYDRCGFSEGCETEVRESTKVVEECLLIYCRSFVAIDEDQANNQRPDASHFPENGFKYFKYISVINGLLSDFGV
jgi:hypothetical protein